ncbi:M56 family metallopeptidase [Stenotrophomonas maltophilia]|uniref:M56 family metallopeptidase n=1 Tax=Stenotrophomonas maltophilia TaxID=40324 RepID=UPI0006AC0162|nr:TonB family protein [Stenotrophomonas maltophilia]KOQ69110.1 peptidase [Stenotrophomonas maltophilia]
MSEVLDSVWRASVWLALAVILLAAMRPLLLWLGGPSLAYRSWWLLPLLLAGLLLPLPALPLLQHVPTLPLNVMPVAPEGEPTQVMRWPKWLLLAWMLGVAISLLRSLRAQQRFERILGRLQARADGSWQASADPGLPALVGLWRPRIVVGPDFDQQFDAREQGLILAHERSHRRNGDHWANGALLLVRAAFWFHPLMPWATRRFLRDQELACDARTIATQPALRGLYASTLLKAQLVHPVAPAVCHWRSQPVLKERIAMLKQSKRKALPWVSGQVLVVGVCACLATVAWASQLGMAGVSSIGVEPAEYAQADAAAAGLQRSAQVERMAPPKYPESAFQQGLTGVVTLKVEIDAEGRPTDVQVLSATNPGVFDAVSITAAKGWTFRPALKDGRPVASAVRIPLTFSMSEDEREAERAR